MCYNDGNRCRQYNHGYVEAEIAYPSRGQGRHACYTQGWEDAIASGTPRGSKGRYVALQSKMRGR